MLVLVLSASRHHLTTTNLGILILPNLITSSFQCSLKTVITKIRFEIKPFNYLPMNAFVLQLHQTCENINVIVKNSRNVLLSS